MFGSKFHTQLVTGIFITFLVTLGGISLACTPIPIFTENEVKELIWHWEQDQLLRIGKEDHSKSAELRDSMCWQNKARYWYHGDRFTADNPLITSDYGFKPNGLWFASITTTWNIPEEHRDSARVAYDWISDKNALSNGEIHRKCLYLVNDKTGDVRPAAID